MALAIMKDRKNIVKLELDRYRKLGTIFFTKNKKEFSILKLNIEVGQSEKKADLGEILYEITKIYQKST